MQLSELQDYFQQYIFDAKIKQLESAIATPPTDSILERLAIYADGYSARLGEALQNTFPNLKAYSGEDLFYEWCDEYIHLYPSSFFSIARIGYLFSEFLKNKNLLLQSEIAALEWAISTAIDAGDAMPVTKTSLEQIPQEKWGDIVLETHPSLQMLLFNYNTIDIYEAVIKKQLKKQSNKPIKITQQIENASNICRVWRKGIQVYYRPIESIEKLFLGSISQKITFGEICEKLSEQMPEDQVVNYAISQILTWLQDELITGIRISHELA